MAQTGYTPIKLYYSATAAAVPLAANLTPGELALNTADGKLFYEDSSGVVQVIGTKGGVGSSSNTQVLYNNAGALAGSANLTFDGSQLTISGIEVGPGAGNITSNVAVGNDALLVNTTGNNNVAVGGNTLKANTTGIRNAGLGYASLLTNISGSYNTGAGALSLAVATGSYNTAVGFNSGGSISTGAKNSILGAYSGFGAPISQTGSNYVVLSDGDGNVRAHWNGANPTFPGAITLSDGTANGVSYLDGSKVLTTGTALTFDGTILSSTRFAGALNGTVGATTPAAGAFTTLTTSSTVTHSGGTANGVAYLNGSKVLTTGTVLAFDGAILGVNGVSVGRGAGAVSGNTAVGSGAVAANTTGTQNTAVGFNSLASNTTPSDNTAVGYAALTANNSDGNTAVGSLALTSSTGGTDNVAVGRQALFASTGDLNVGVGVNTLAAAGGGSSNVAIGAYALNVCTSNFNTAVGRNALAGATTGSINTGIGTDAGAGITTGSYNVILGSYDGIAAPISQTGSNYIVLSDGAGNVRGTFDGSGRLGIGVTSLSEYLTVKSPNASTFFNLQTAADSGVYMGNNAGSLTLLTGATERVRIDSSGNVTLQNNISVGGAAPTTSGTGITFPATQSASSNANTLDDYEEGSWTAGISFGGAATGITYSTNTGFYTRVGNLVTLSCYILLTNKGSSTGSARITGLPFTCATNSGAYAAPGLFFTNVTFSGQVSGYVNINATTIDLTQTSVLGVNSALADTNFANNSSFILNVTYRAQ